MSKLIHLICLVTLLTAFGLSPPILFSAFSAAPALFAYVGLHLPANSLRTLSQQGGRVTGNENLLQVIKP